MERYYSRMEQLKYWLLAWASLAQEAVTILSLGFVIPQWRAKVLFSAWIDRV